MIGMTRVMRKAHGIEHDTWWTWHAKSWRLAWHIELTIPPPSWSARSAAIRRLAKRFDCTVIRRTGADNVHA